MNLIKFTLGLLLSIFQPWLRETTFTFIHEDYYVETRMLW